MTTKSIFISYRRSDRPNLAFWLHDVLHSTFVDTEVFIDEKGLQAGDKWVEHLERNLRSASVLIVVIGPDWLRAQDEYFRRRLDEPSDWVRKEVEFGITNNLVTIPLLVSDAKLPDVKALPESLVPLLSNQSLKLRTEYWREDVNALINTIEKKGFQQAINSEISNVDYPTPGCQPATPLSEQELDEELLELSQWRRVNRKLKGGISTELMRKYEFETFEAAMHFMLVASRRISRVNHHPTWQNLWRTVTVWLTTWDNGAKPSYYDIEMAKYLDGLYFDYAPRDSKTTLNIDPGLLAQLDLMVEQGMFPNRSTALQAAISDSLKRLENGKQR
ncbi:MAG: 4a-hydroxytetrahydrobiopterin dehydratase [Cyanobacteria bacterium P01_H01_bin.162]